MKKSGKNAGNRTGNRTGRSSSRPAGRSDTRGHAKPADRASRPARQDSRVQDSRAQDRKTYTPKTQDRELSRARDRDRSPRGDRPERSGSEARSERPARDHRAGDPRSRNQRDGKPAAQRRDTARPAKFAGTARDQKNEKQVHRQDHRRARDTAVPHKAERVSVPKNLGPRPSFFGLHAVREAWLNPKRSVHALYLTPDAQRIFDTWPVPRVERPLPIPATKEAMDRMLGRDAVHQGIAISAAPLEDVFIQDLINIGADKDRSVILMLDQVTDPHNVGAILRSASAFGADGVIMQRRHAPELEGVLCKTASGAVDHLPVAYETNLSRSLEDLAEAGYTVIGLDEHADDALNDIAIPEKAVLVLGAEGDGMRRLIREHCTVLVTLPTQKPINSLNVSNAAAVALYALISG